ncbi:MAG: glucose-6-phosphate isomerase, partial [Flavobacterium sp.]
MALPNINPTTTESWHKLKQHFAEMENASMQEMFANDPLRAEKFHLQWNDFLLDYSKNIINQETLELLLDLASETGLKGAIAACFSGEKINQTENRAVLHAALRAPETAVITIDGKNIIP